MSLRPILFHVFPKPLPYIPALALQERIHQLQAKSRTPEKELSQATLASTAHPDVLLLLEHRPVYTAGRRQDAQELEDERKLLVKSGADWVATQRGGETTYHGPGQIVGYPLFDLPRMGMRTREHVCLTQNLLKYYLKERHKIQPFETSHTGVFYSDTQKLASIGMQVRHGLTSHGFAINITKEPVSWFGQVIACGLADVKAETVESVKELASDSTISRSLDMKEEMHTLAKMFGDSYKRSIREINREDGDVWGFIKEMEEVAEQAGDWPKRPLRD